MRRQADGNATKTHDSELLNVPDPQQLVIIIDGQTVHDGVATDANLHTRTATTK